MNEDVFSRVEEEPAEGSDPPGRKGSAMADSADEEDDGRVGDEERRAGKPLEGPLGGGISRPGVGEPNLEAISAQYAMLASSDANGSSRAAAEDGPASVVVPKVVAGVALLVDDDSACSVVSAAAFSTAGAFLFCLPLPRAG